MTERCEEDSLLSQGQAALAEGKPQEAFFIFMRAQASEPNNPLASLGLGMALCQQSRINEALTVFQHTLKQQTSDPNIPFSIADALDRAGESKIAEAIYREVLKSNPEHLPSSHNLGSLLYRTERFAEAITQHTVTIEQHPESSATWRDLGQSMIAAEQIDLGIQILESAQLHFPEDQNTRFALGLGYLRNENWDKGWPLYEARWAAEEDKEFTVWHGESLHGRHLLIRPEQGFGDNLMFARYIPTLAKEAKHVSLLTPPALQRLLSNILSQIPNISVTDSANELIGVDYSCLIGSLPLHCLSRSVTAPPPPLSYPIHTHLQGNKQPTTLGKPIQTKKTYALVWRGQPNYSANQNRSIPLGQLLPQLPKQNINYVSLQIDASCTEKELLSSYGITNHTDQIHDFQDTAEQLANLDGLISVDTSSAHLAGAMQTPLFLLQRQEGEWRWGPRQDGRSWYKNCFPIILKNGQLEISSEEFASLLASPLSDLAKNES